MEQRRARARKTILLTLILSIGILWPSKNLVVLSLVQLTEIVAIFFLCGKRRLSLPAITASLVLIGAIFVAALFFKNPAILRYIFPVCAFVIFQQVDIPVLTGSLISCLVLVIVVCILQDSILLDVINSAYRSSDQEIHAERITGPFLYPGDLGVFLFFAVFTIFGLKQYSATKIKVLEYLLLFASIYYIFSSGSRMAIGSACIAVMVTLFASLPRPNARKYTYSLLAGCFTAAIVYWWLPKSGTYLFKDNYYEILSAFLSFESDSRFKRASELSFIFGSGDTGFEADFFESSVASMKDKLGSAITAAVWVFTPVIFFIKRSRTYPAFILAVLIAVWLTSSVSAPLERPKLAILLLLVVLLCIKSTKQRLSAPQSRMQWSPAVVRADNTARLP